MRDYITLLIETDHGILDRKTFPNLTECKKYARFIAKQCWVEERKGCVISVRRLP